MVSSSSSSSNSRSVSSTSTNSNHNISHSHSQSIHNKHRTHNHSHNHSRYWVCERGIIIAIISVVLIGLLYDHNRINIQFGTSKQENQKQQSYSYFYNNQEIENQNQNSNVVENKKNNNERLLLRSSNNNKNINDKEDIGDGVDGDGDTDTTGSTIIDGNHHSFIARLQAEQEKTNKVMHHHHIYNDDDDNTNNNVNNNNVNVNVNEKKIDDGYGDNEINDGDSDGEGYGNLKSEVGVVAATEVAEIEIETTTVATHELSELLTEKEEEQQVEVTVVDKTNTTEPAESESESDETVETAKTRNPLNWRRQDPNHQRVLKEKMKLLKEEEEWKARRKKKAKMKFTNSNSNSKNNNSNSTNENNTTTTNVDDNNKTDDGDGDDGLNIILFYADDWTMNVLGKLNSLVHTPNIDKMADKGILFVNNCVTTSVCWISRATLMTGMYYSRHLQSVPHVTNMFTSENWNSTLFPLLKNVGNYYTGLVGKWHAPFEQEYMDRAFSEYSKLYYGDHWLDWFSDTDPKEMEHVTDLNRRHAIDFLRNRPKDQKFALKVSFFATHAVDGHEISYQPMNTTRQTYYPDFDATMADSASQPIFIPSKTATNKHWEDLPWFFNDQTAGRARWRNRFEPKTWQKNIRDLYAMATEVDWAIGEIIKELQEQGVLNHTMLIFTTDNGDLHGEHGLVEKWYPFEESIKVPLVIQDPRMSKEKHGSINEEFTLNIDLASTMLNAANIQPSSFMQGRDIAELYLDYIDLDDDDEEEENNSNNGTAKEEPLSSLSSSIHESQQNQIGRKQTQRKEQSSPRRRRLTATTTNNTDTNTDVSDTFSSLSTSTSTSTYKKKKTKKQQQQQQHKPWRKEWFYEWNMGHPLNASGHAQEHFIDAAFALITEEWKYIYWPQKEYEQLYHRSIDVYDEYDILQNYFITVQKYEQKIYQPEGEWMRILQQQKSTGGIMNYTTTKNPLGDSIQSTQEIYQTLKARFYELKDHVQYGYRI